MGILFDLDNRKFSVNGRVFLCWLQNMQKSKAFHSFSVAAVCYSDLMLLYYQHSQFPICNKKLLPWLAYYSTNRVFLHYLWSFEHPWLVEFYLPLLVSYLDCILYSDFWLKTSLETFHKTWKFPLLGILSIDHRALHPKFHNFKWLRDSCGDLPPDRIWGKPDCNCSSTDVRLEKNQVHS